MIRSLKLSRPLIALIAVAALGGCAKKSHDLDETGGVAIKRSNCPAVAVPVGTGDITLFNPAGSSDSRAVDVVANLTNIRVTCNDTPDTPLADDVHKRRQAHHHHAEAPVSGADIVSTATFDIEARRSDANGARDVVLPYFSVVMQGGNIVIAKRVSQVTLHFADGQLRTSATGTAGASIDRAAATLPNELLQRVNKKRKSGEEDAAIDPLADPAVRDQIARATFELLVGFQLTSAELQYNATR